MATYAIACGVLTLAGWYWNVPRLTDWLQDGISMFPITAACAIACGAALLLKCGANGEPRRRAGAAFFGLISCTLGLMTLFEHVTLIDLGIDTMLVKREWGQNAAASLLRMGLPASISFAALGLAMCLLATGKPWARKAASSLGVLCGAIASLSLMGYFYGADQLFSLPQVTGIARQAATSILAVSAGVVAVVPEWGLCNLMSRNDGGGVLARRVLPAVGVMAILIGWIRLTGQEASLYDAAFGTAMRTLVEIGLFLLLVWWTANSLSRAERELRASRAEVRIALDEAMKASRFKDEFLATLSHELRNPMTAILGWAGLLRSEVDASANVELAHGLHVIEKSAKLQAQMIDDLLDISRIASGKTRLNIQNVELAEVTRSAIDVVRPGAEAKGIALGTHFAKGVSRVRADPARLQQVPFNLLTNAVKFTPSGGSVNIECTQMGSHVEIAVSDTGIGIDPDFLPHAFERFRQQDATASKQYGGLGLGLAIARHLVELHGGEMKAESEGTGKGARFTVRLPLAAPPGQPASVPARAPSVPPGEADLAGLRILVVEDDEEVRELLNRILGGSGAIVTLAKSADEAIAKLVSAAPNVIVSDIGMPGEDGYSLLKRVRESGVTARAVALTSFAGKKDRARSQEAGFDAHVAKPINTNELFAAILGPVAQV